MTIVLQDHYLTNIELVKKQSKLVKVGGKYDEFTDFHRLFN